MHFETTPNHEYAESRGRHESRAILIKGIEKESVKTAKCSSSNSERSLEEERMRLTYTTEDTFPYCWCC